MQSRINTIAIFLSLANAFNNISVNLPKEIWKKQHI